MARRKRENQEAFDRALRYFEESQRFHNDLIRKVEKRYKAYKGIVDTISDAARWTSKLYPPYIMHIVETTLASLVDDRIRYRVRPRATLESYFDPDYAERARRGAEAHQILSDWQIKASKFNQAIRPFVLQNAIAGITVAKNFWVTREERRRRLVSVEEPVLDDNGDPVISPFTGQPLTYVRMEEETKPVVVYDGPVTEVRDIHDFGWHEAAVSIERSRYVWDRVWMSAEEFFEGYGGDSPLWGPERGGWPESDAREILGTSRDFKDEYQFRWNENVRDHSKDLIEVVEVWDQVRGEVITIVNRKVLASYRQKFPFFFERPPFVTCTTQSDLFQVVGISQVEKIQALQQMLWDVMNQRIDNLRLINNAIFFFRPDLEDPSAYSFEPGAQWPVEDPTQVGMWQPNVIPAEVSLGAEALLKGDLQNLAGGFPFSSGTDSQVVDQKTATGASIVTSLAQRSIDMAKKAVYEAWAEVGRQRLILNQQFIREPTVAPVMGLNGEEEIAVIMPELLQGEYDFEIEPVPDALARQEEQASAQALFQLGLAAVPQFAALAAQGQAQMINIDALWEDTLKAFGKDDVKRYFKSQAPAAVPPGPGGVGGLGAGAPVAPGEQPVGVTAPQSIDPAVSPSSGLSLSPVQHIQRALALSRGGERNV
ncbi:MAG: hypothetical protein KatS3mg015_2800 [Fimbriimonadales bacterium]|nr:MAG: hypothetical protein KatS3mg015_2800 [Fimbriimonadales bacterium]